MPMPPQSHLQIFYSAVAPRELSRPAQWMETFAIPIVAVAMAWLTHSQDPTLRTVNFPWLWFAPTLVALRYGVMAGLLATSPLIANWFLADALLGDIGAFPQGHYFGGILLVLLCGEFADLWRDRHEQLEETNLYMAERVSRLTRRHLLLNLSHDRLEQEMLTRPGSLRDALVQLRDSVLSWRKDDPLPAAAELLHILAQYTHVQAASLHPVEPHTGRLAPAVQKLGDPEPLSPDDALLRAALESGQLAHVAEFAEDEAVASKQRVVAPLLASDHTLLGVLAVSQLPFFALNGENLQFMAIVLGYYADSVRSAPALGEVRSRLPTIPATFADELMRMIALRKRFGTDSQIVAMHFQGARGNEIVEQLVRIKRGIDLYWKTDIAGAPMLVVLMPFATPAGKEGFLKRIQDWLHSRFGGDFESLNIALHTIDFASQDPVAELQSLIQA